MKLDQTKKTISDYESQGYLVGRVEGFASVRATVSRDLWGIFDLIAVKPGAPPVAIQVTGAAGGHFAAHFRKMLSRTVPWRGQSLHVIQFLLSSGWDVRLEAWGFRTRKGERYLAHRSHHFTREDIEDFT